MVLWALWCGPSTCSPYIHLVSHPCRAYPQLVWLCTRDRIPHSSPPGSTSPTRTPCCFPLVGLPDDALCFAFWYLFIYLLYNLFYQVECRLPEDGYSVQQVLKFQMFLFMARRHVKCSCSAFVVPVCNACFCFWISKTGISDGQRTSSERTCLYTKIQCWN